MRLLLRKNRNPVRARGSVRLLWRGGSISGTEIVSTMCHTHGYFFQYTYNDTQLLPQFRRHEAQNNPPTGDSQPEPRSSHTTGEGLSMSYSSHERHDPAAQSNFNAYISEKEKSADPCDPGVVFSEKGLTQSTLGLFSGGVILRCRRARIPEGSETETKFDRR